MSSSRPIDIVVPFYRNAPLVTSLFTSLRACAGELAALGCRVIAVNDSPQDSELEDALSAETGIPDLEVRLIRNQRNLGFVKSVNNALAVSAVDNRDVLLLNSDTILFPGAVQEMADVACLDPMIGFVSPRSNNATICSLPHAREYRGLPPEKAHALFRTLSCHLPRFQYVPTAVGFCLLIKAGIIAEFGFFDEAYAPGYNEENDLIMRANRCGYRAVLANRAYVYHMGEASFSLTDVPPSAHEREHAALLAARYPEYPVSVGRYLGSARHEAERLLTGLIPYSDGRLDLVFDFSNIGLYHCGTFELAKKWLAHALEQWRDRFHIHVLVSEEAKRFHELGNLPGLFFVPVDTKATFAVAFRVGQPFDYPTMLRMSRLAVVNVYAMLDPIAYDCQYLSTEELDQLWRLVMEHADGVVYISDFVRREFNLRFPSRPGLRELVAYPSTNPDDYRAPEGKDKPGDHFLIVGNSFAHKRLLPSASALSEAFPSEKFVLIGTQAAFGKNVVCYPSGNLTETEIEQAYINAKAVIYPSLYEGFGLPVVTALAFGRPVFARAIPVMLELRDRLPNRDNLYLYSSVEELIDLLKAKRWSALGKSTTPDTAQYGWRESVRDIGNLLEQAVRSDSIGEKLVRRIDALWSCSGTGAGGGPRSADSRTQQLEREIVDIRNSWSWRVTAPIRTVGRWYLRMRNGYS